MSSSSICPVIPRVNWRLEKITTPYHPSILLSCCLLSTSVDVICRGREGEGIHWLRNLITKYHIKTQCMCVFSLLSNRVFIRHRVIWRNEETIVIIVNRNDIVSPSAVVAYLTSSLYLSSYKEQIWWTGCLRSTWERRKESSLLHWLQLTLFNSSFVLCDALPIFLRFHRTGCGCQVLLTLFFRAFSFSWENISHMQHIYVSITPSLTLSFIHRHLDLSTYSVWLIINITL